MESVWRGGQATGIRGRINLTDIDNPYGPNYDPNYDPLADNRNGSPHRNSRSSTDPFNLDVSAVNTSLASTTDASMLQDGHSRLGKPEKSMSAAADFCLYQKEAGPPLASVKLDAELNELWFEIFSNDKPFYFDEGVEKLTKSFQ